MKNLLKALASFQFQCPAITKSSNNPFFKSKYAQLDAIQHHIKPLLDRNGLVVSQPTTVIDGIPYVQTYVYHVESGEVISSCFPIVVQKQTAQDYGSAVTYAKRYSLSGVLNLIIEDEDDDGEKAMSRDAAPPQKEWLTDKHKDWAAVVKRAESGSLEISKLRQFYNISKAVEAQLSQIKAS
jgi:hypothetical protein